MGARVLGIVGWSGSGKTTLLVRLIPVLAARGLRVATLKHAHHAFQVDLPGKDSYEHRQAGASEVIVFSSSRWVQIHENAGESEPTLAQLLRRLSPCDLVLIEGFKREPYPKLEVFRAIVGKPPLHPGDPHIVALAAAGSPPAAAIPVVDLDDIAAVADLVCAKAEPLDEVLKALEA
ncbi:MAG: molybdopterin-guanine dinucleotide biosynthesis protein B [Caulobacteraceae bacterium]